MSQYNSCGAPMKNTGCLLLRPLMLEAKLSKFLKSPPKYCRPNFDGFGGVGSGV